MPYFTLSKQVWWKRLLFWKPLGDNGRSGQLRVNSKQMKTPSIYYQNSYPGGGGDVTRFITYTDLRNERIPTFYIFYYLSGQGTFKFTMGYEILNNEPINEFTIRSREIFCGQREIQTRNGAAIVNPANISNRHPYNTLTINNWNPIALLDSGFGNFLMSSIEKILVTNQNPGTDEVFSVFQRAMPDYFEFCENHSFDVMIALDYANKNTDKKWAANVELQRIANEMINNVDEQIRLLRESILQLKSNNYNFAVFAPLHGENPEQFRDFTNRILEMENEEGGKFDGFAIAPPKKPEERVLSVKAVRNTLEQNDDTRPIHALGSGAIKDVIPLVYAGVDMFDNVTAWRRATEGRGGSALNVNDPNAVGSFSSFLIPLVDRNGNIITDNQEKVLGYVPLNEINTNFSCDCNICRRFDLTQIKDLYRQGTGNEDFYLAKNLLYNHAINQYDLICNRLRRDIRNDIDIMTLINEITDPAYRKRTTDLVETIQNFN
tara:strand:+ start:1040 stop:2512 length:1473 start_codon:yes stop_codon:yes gene_type:complete